ncbi:MAG: PstS family phosphate ABC transporter substrate-binding protein [Spiroplasma sp.]
MKWKHIWVFLWPLTLLAIFIITLINHSPYFLLGGSSSVAPIIEELLTKYPNNHKNGDFNYASSASSGAPLRVKNSLFGIGWLSKEYTTDDTNLFTFQMMSDGLVIVYNLPAENLEKPNVLLDFSPEKVQQLYLHNKSWKEIFPSEIKTDITVKPFTRPNGSGTRDIFDKQVLNQTTYYKANTVDSSSAMLNLDPGSIGYTSFADFVQAKETFVNIGSWKGIKATFENIKNKTYKLSRPFTGLINYQYKYKKEIAYLLKWIFGFDSEVEAIFKKFGPRIELNDPVNLKLKTWLESWK